MFPGTMTQFSHTLSGLNKLAAIPENKEHMKLSNFKRMKACVVYIHISVLSSLQSDSQVLDLLASTQQFIFTCHTRRPESPEAAHSDII